ncbi:ribonuclease H-like domain-containing protein, partial [Tanacetum coccineum]
VLEELFTHKEEMDLETTQTTTTAKLPILKQENGNSFKLVAQTTTNADGTSTSLIPGPVTTKEKAQKNNDVKARSMLLMVLPNEHLMTFNQYKDAKTLFAAIQTRFGGNEATKKTQKTLLKQIQLAILGENISQEDLNWKFSRSLPSKWNTHVVVWRNKPDLDTMSFDDLYNNFKIVEQEVKGTASSSSQNMAFVSSPSSTNEVNTANGVSTANTQVSPTSTQVSTTSTQVSTANLSDDTVYAFLASQPNESQLVYEDLEQIHEDDIKEMDLKWQLALLSMRTRRFFHKTCRKIAINRSDTAGYDKSNVECFNCHKMGHFTRECRGPRNQDNRNRNQDNSRRTVNVEETSSKAIVTIDGASFDWIYMAYDEVPTNMALMAFSDSEFNLATYKRGLAFVEEQLVFYKNNEVIFCEQLVVLKRDISYKDSELSMLKSELEKLKQEKESNQLKIENFDNASKRLFSPPKFDLSNSSLEEFQQPEFEGYGRKTSKSVSEDISNEAHFNYHQRERVVSGNIYTRVNYNYFAKKTHPIAQRNMVPRAVLMKTGIKAVNIARPVNTAHSKTIVYNARPMPKAVNTARPNSTLVNDVRAHQGHPQKEDQGYVDSGCSRNMTWNMSCLSDFKEFDRGYVTFRGGAKRGKITSKGTLKTADGSQVLLKVPRKNNMYSVDIKNIVPKECLTCLVTKATLDESMIWHRRLGIKREFSVARTPQENGIAERRNRTLIEAARTMLADSKLPTTFWAEAINTACYVQNRVLVVKPHNKTPYELFRGRTPATVFKKLEHPAP